MAVWQHVSEGRIVKGALRLLWLVAAIREESLMYVVWIYYRWITGRWYANKVKTVTRVDVKAIAELSTMNVSILLMRINDPDTSQCICLEKDHQRLTYHPYWKNWCFQCSKWHAFSLILPYFSHICFSTESETLSAWFQPFLRVFFQPIVKTLQNPNLARKCWIF